LNLEPQIWTAEVVYAGLGTPMLGGGLVVVGEHIAAVGQLAELRSAYPDAPIMPKGKALTPPVVNAHTHLDLSRLPYDRDSYVGFIQRVIAHAPHRGIESAQLGLAELQASSTAAFGDIVARNEVMDFLLLHSPLPGVAYREVLGANLEKAQEHFQTMVPLLRAWKKREGNVKVGLSPHTAHTVSAPLMKRLVEFSRLEGFPIQIHIAESPEETAYFKDNAGELAKFMAPFNPGWRAKNISPIQYLADLDVLGPTTTLVHGVQVSENDVQIIAQTGCKMVSCPRSNQGLECGLMPWRLYLKYNIEVALGTDSRGSSPDLNVRNEALFLWDKVDPRVLVRATTLSGYKVLGLKVPRITRGSPLALVQSW